MSWISREDLMEWLETEEDEMREIDDREAAHEASYIRKHVMEMPKEDVKPVAHAHWIPESPNKYTRKAYKHTCSECGRAVFDGRQVSMEEIGYYFCPHCGAKMIEPQESEDKE